MPQPYRQSARGKKIMELLKKSDNVTSLRHANAEEYREIFCDNREPPNVKRLQYRRRTSSKQSDTCNIKKYTHHAAASLHPHRKVQHTTTPQPTYYSAVDSLQLNEKCNLPEMPPTYSTINADLLLQPERRNSAEVPPICSAIYIDLPLPPEGRNSAEIPPMCSAIYLDLPLPPEGRTSAEIPPICSAGVEYLPLPPERRNSAEIPPICSAIDVDLPILPEGRNSAEIPPICSAIYVDLPLPPEGRNSAEIPPICSAIDVDLPLPPEGRNSAEIPPICSAGVEYLPLPPERRNSAEIPPTCSAGVVPLSSYAPFKSWSLSDLTQDTITSNTFHKLRKLKSESSLMTIDGMEHSITPFNFDLPSSVDVSSRPTVERSISPPPSRSNEFQVRLSAKSWSLNDLTQDVMICINLKKQNSETLLVDERYKACDYDFVPEYGNVDEGRKRRHIPQPSKWKKNQAKIRRMHGEEYLGFSKPAQGKFKQDTIRPARQLGETCKSVFCRKSKVKRHCHKFTEKCRQQLHELFWKKMNWDQRKVFLSNLVTVTQTARKTKSVTDDKSRREGTLSYFLPIKQDGSEKVQVCRQMFLNTLSLGSYTVQAWAKQAEFCMSLSHDKQYAAKTKGQSVDTKRKMLSLETFLNDIPKLPSHYARHETNKIFIEPMYHTLAELFKCYKEYCADNNEPQVSRCTFEKKFYEKNLSLYTLKKDMCDSCASYKAGNVSEEDHHTHIKLKDRARKEKEEDKKKAAAGEFILLTMDLESVKVCPFLTASALYFKTKLTCHNFTVYDLTTKHCTCYWFTETSADLTASTFASFLVDYIERHCLSRNKPIVIYSDGCTYQNRNAILANALLNLSKKHDVEIVQKYLVPGHTQMECDSVHSAIERKLKNREIYLPSDYIQITKSARSTQPYETVDVQYDFVKDYSNPDNHCYKSIRPGRKAGDPHVVDIRAIKYNTMTMEVKLDHDEDWMSLPQRPKILETVSYRQLHERKIPIKSSKYNHLQQLKSVLPADCHAFYDSLPFE